MNLVTLRTNVKLTLGMAAGSQLSDDEIDRGVNQAVNAINRFFPRERVFTSVYNKTITDEAVTSNDDTVVALANKPLRFGSEIVKLTSDPTTIFTKDTDYEMDYLSGTITTIGAGAIPNSTAILVSYENDPLMIDISSILTEMISIDKVNIRTAHENIETENRFRLWGDYITLIGEAAAGQEAAAMSDDSHINIYYYGQHTEPTASASGSFRRFLDEYLVIGASGYGLLMEGTSRDHQAVVDLASARTTIGNIAALHTSIGTTFTSSATPRGDINTALDAAIVELAKISAVADLANTEFDLANPEVDKYTTPLDLAVTRIADANTALVNVDTILDRVNTSVLAGVSNADALTALNQIDAELDKIPTAADALIAELVSSTRNADAYLDTGDALFNSINNVVNAPGEQLGYAQAKIQMADLFAREGTLRGTYASGRVAEASARIAVGRVFIAEAAGRMEHANANLAGATSDITLARTYIEGARGYIAVGNAYLQEGATRINNALGYIQEATNRIAEFQSYLTQIATYINQITTYLAEADRYQSIADRERSIAISMRTQGAEYIRSYITALRSKAGTIQRPSTSSVRQYANEGVSQYR